MRQPDGTYQAITTVADLKDLAYVLGDFGEVISLDTETTSLDYLTCELLGISITHKPGLGYYIPVKRHLRQELLWDNPSDFLDIEIVRFYLNPVLSNPRKVKTLHNAKFDLHVLERHGFIISEPVYDTMIGAWVLGNVHGARYGLKDLAERKLGFKMTEFKEVAGKHKDFSLVPLKEATLYAAADADMTARLYVIEEEKFHNGSSHLVPTRDLEMPCVRVLKKMEEVGALIDRPYLSGLDAPLRRQMKFHEKRVYDNFGDFNINSQDELKDKIYRHLGVVIPDVKFSTLFELKENYPIIESILHYTKRQKIHSVYVKGILELLDSNDRVHTEYRQNLKTGRLSSNHPNLQNIPTKKDDDSAADHEFVKDLPLIRKAFIAKPDYKIVSIDYSQLELRITAHLANEQSWIDAFANGVDIHKATAATVLKIPLSKVNKEQRRKAKAINFGLLYGMTEFGLSKRINCSIDEAKEFIAQYFEHLDGIRRYIENRRAEVRGRKFVQTEIGRRLYFNWNLENPKSLPAAEREGINMPVQGQAADIVKKAMVEIDSLLDNYRTKMILQVHDELDFEMPISEMPILIPQIKEIMEGVFKLKVDLKCDVEYGDNWEELQDYEGV